MARAKLQSFSAKALTVSLLGSFTRKDKTPKKQSITATQNLIFVKEKHRNGASKKEFYCKPQISWETKLGVEKSKKAVTFAKENENEMEIHEKKL